MFRFCLFSTWRRFPSVWPAPEPNGQPNSKSKQSNKQTETQRGDRPDRRGREAEGREEDGESALRLADESGSDRRREGQEGDRDERDQQKNLPDGRDQSGARRTAHCAHCWIPPLAQVR